MNDQPLAPAVNDWVRIARRDGGPGLDTSKVTKLGTFHGEPCVEIDGGRWVPVRRITEIVT